MKKEEKILIIKTLIQFLNIGKEFPSQSDKIIYNKKSITITEKDLYIKNIKLKNRLVDISNRYQKIIDNQENNTNSLKEILTERESKNLFMELKICLFELNNDIREFFFLDYGINLQMFKDIGFDIEEKLTPTENNFKKNIKESNIELDENIKQEDLFKLLLKDNFENQDEEIKNNSIKRFLVDLANFEKTEINGWFIEVIKNDFIEVKKIIKEIVDNRLEKETLLFEIYKLINNRGVKVQGSKDIENNKEISIKRFNKPFESLKDMKFLMGFDSATNGMPDIIYFPKDKSKNIVANNISAYDIPTHSYSIFHNFYKISKMNDIIGNKVNKDSHISNTINEDSILKKELSFLAKQKDTWSFENIKNDLKEKSFDEIFNTDKISFTTTIESSILTVFNQRKDYKITNKENLNHIKNLKEVEKINTLIFMLSLIGDENKRFNKNSNNDEIENKKNNELIELIFQKINVGILSKAGIYTETTNNNIEKSITILLDFLTKKDNFELFEKSNKLGHDYSDTFKDFIQKAVNYIAIIYPNLLMKYEKEHKIMMNSLFSACNFEYQLTNDNIKRENKTKSSIKKMIERKISKVDICDILEITEEEYDNHMCIEKNIQ